MELTNSDKAERALTQISDALKDLLAIDWIDENGWSEINHALVEVVGYGWERPLDPEVKAELDRTDRVLAETAEWLAEEEEADAAE